MKKLVVLLVVVAITLVSATAFADVTVGATYDIRSRNFDNLAVSSKSADAATAGATIGPLAGGIPAAGNQKDTQQRIRIDVNGKVGETKGKLQLESDFGAAAGTAFGAAGTEAYSVSDDTGTLGFREAWVMFPLPVAPVTIKTGHMLLMLSNGWFFRSMHFGSDAWVAFNDTGGNHFGLVNIKSMEINTAKSDDIDAYSLVDTFKINENNLVGLNITRLVDRKGTIGSKGGIYGTFNPFKEIFLQNYGVHYTGKMGPLSLMAQADVQKGVADGYFNPNGATAAQVGPTTSTRFLGNQIVIQGNVALSPVTINFLVGRGSGNRPTNGDQLQIATAMDVDPHYTFLYEYKVNTAANNYLTGAAAGTSKNTGMANTTCLSAGATVAVTKNVSVGADVYILNATEPVALNGAYETYTNLPSRTRDLGTELDVKIGWKIADNVSWNWTLGYFKPGHAYDRMYDIQPWANSNEGAWVAYKMDPVTGIQGLLAFKF